MELGLRGRVALIGGSSRGLGYAVAERLLREGAAVVINGRDQARLAFARATLGSLGRVISVAGDFADPELLAAAVASAQQTFGRIDIAIGNAGGPPAKPLLETTWEEWTQGIDALLKSAVCLAQTVIPHFRQAGWGRLLYITSVAVKQPLDNLVISNSVRAGVVGMAKTLSREVGHPQITVNCVLPGYTQTERLGELARAISTRTQSSVDAVYQQWCHAVPLGRVASPAEFADVVAFLVSERASYLNGVSLQIDGGLSRALL